tara:strand:+ start:111 stop:425 length:315 start_codon:yes stop_codon:yes gene_type:complete
MGILVKTEITISKGFKNWKKMVYAQDEKLKEHGIKFIFAGTEKDNPSKLHAVMQFPNMEALQAFKDDKQLSEKRREAGAVIETAVMIPISDEYITNYPDAYIKH